MATRAQLVEAAAEVFAEQGYRAATVRDICERAGANIAAINYHFGGKDSLYAEVLQSVVRAAWERYPPTLGLKASPTALERLRAFVRSFLLRIFDQGPQAVLGRLVLREMVEPTHALDEIVEKQLRPMAGYLTSIVRELLGTRASEVNVRLCGMSIVGQIIFYHHNRAALSRLFPEMELGANEIDLLTEHITSFSLAALKELSKASPARKVRR